MPSIVSNSSSQSAPTADKPSNFPQPKKTAADEKETKDLDHALAVMQSYIKKKGLQATVFVTMTERGVVVTVMTDKMLFDSGKADLKTEQIAVLNKVADVINAVPNKVRIEGNTDSLGIHTVRFGDNWDLSVIRATTVLRYFQARNVNPDRLEAAGYADQRPIAPNDTESGRSRNRRVDIVIERQYSSKAKVF
jgi:chemotaxis protein MotB